jgi:hypothetical protein
MFAKIILIAVLAVLYGLAWHNQPAKPASIDMRADRSPADGKKPAADEVET